MRFSYRTDVLAALVGGTAVPGDSANHQFTNSAITTYVRR